MRISAVSNNNISFQKTLVAEANVLKNNEAYPCLIYKLDERDKDYFKNLLANPDCRFPDYLEEIKSDYDYYEIDKNQYSEGTDFFVMEDENSDCLGILEVFESEESGTKDINYITVAKDCYSANDKRSIKYVGETLLAFVGKQLQRDGYNRRYTVFAPAKSALKFYMDKCGFSQIYEGCYRDMSPELFLPRNKIPKLIAQNEEHTKGKIELLL